MARRTMEGAGISVIKSAMWKTMTSVIKSPIVIPVDVEGHCVIIQREGKQEETALLLGIERYWSKKLFQEIKNRYAFQPGYASARILGDIGGGSAQQSCISLSAKYPYCGD